MLYEIFVGWRYLYAPRRTATLWLLLAFAAVIAGAGAGLFAGLAGMLTVQLGCPMHTAPHMAAGHVLIPLAAGAAGYGLGLLAQRAADAQSRARA